MRHDGGYALVVCQPHTRLPSFDVTAEDVCFLSVGWTKKDALFTAQNWGTLPRRWSLSKLRRYSAQNDDGVQLVPAADELVSRVIDAQYRHDEFGEGLWSMTAARFDGGVLHLA
jgi:hypothetical protein